MSDNVEILNMVTTHDLPPDRILEAAKDKLDRVVVLGWTKEGEEYFTASFCDGGDMLWMMERAKVALMAAAEDTE